MKLGVGLYGSNGHQIHQKLKDHPRAHVVAFAGIEEADLQCKLSERGAVRHPSLQSLVADPAVSLVSFCSPRRIDQPREAMLAMHSGKDVFVEKPAAMTLLQLEELRRTSEQTHRRFFEMGAVAFEQPATAIRRIVSSGAVGEVVQVISRKSYPYHSNRPQDEAVDGGLIMQCAIHGVRLVERASFSRVTQVSAIETSFGNPVQGGRLQMASCISMKLANGGIATVTANYLNALGKKVWGDDAVRVYGTRGMIEYSAEGCARVVLGDVEGPLDLSDAPPDDFETVIDCLVAGHPIPLSAEDQFHPLKVVICAKTSAERGGAPIVVG